jgi:hypothetical protein
MSSDFDLWRKELLQTGDIVQDGDTSVPQQEKEKRFNRCVEMVKAVKAAATLFHEVHRGEGLGNHGIAGAGTICKGPGACLSPAGRKHCLADVEPLPRDGNKAILASKVVGLTPKSSAALSGPLIFQLAASKTVLLDLDKEPGEFSGLDWLR